MKINFLVIQMNGFELIKMILKEKAFREFSFSFEILC
jgi:hypothetical protein